MSERSDRGDRSSPWWASGRTGDPGLDSQDPLDAHRQARRGDPPDDAHDDEVGGDGESSTWQRLARELAGHQDGEVCDACPVCIGLRALRQSRPEVIGHLADAAHHLSLALQAFADAQAGDDDRLERVDVDP